MTALELDVCFASDIGPKRPNNEDVLASHLETNFFVIADGIGGHKAGEIAAKEATDELSRAFFELLAKEIGPQTKDDWLEHLKLCLERTNNHVYQLSKKDPAYSGMGTTLCCLYFYQNLALYGHVGDSRIYLYRNQKIYQLTKDHSHIKKRTCQTSIPPRVSTYRAITRAIGTCPTVQPEMNCLVLKKEDIFLLCTDGLSDFVKAKEIEKLFTQNQPLSDLTQNLLSTAKDNGSCDNISLLLVTVKEINEPSNLPG